MVKEFLLPNWASAAESQINLSSGSRFDGFHDFGHGKAPAVCTAQRRVDQVNVVGHHDGGVQIIFRAVFVETTFENHVPS